MYPQIMQGRAFLLLFVAIAFPPLPAMGQEPPPSAATTESTAVQSRQTVPAVTLPEVETALALVESDTRISDEQKATLRTTYQQVIDALKQTDQFAAKLKSFKAALTTAPENAEENRKLLATLQSVQPAINVDPESDSSDQRKVVDAQRATLQGLEDQLASVREERLATEARPLEIGKRLPEAQQDYSLVRNKWGELEAPEDETDPTKQVQRFLLQSNAMRLTGEIAMMKQGNLSQSVRVDDLESRSELLARQVELAQLKTDALSKRLEQALSSDVERIKTLARDASDDLPDDTAVQELAAEVRHLALEFEGVVENKSRVAPVSREVNERFQEVNIEYRDIRSELALSSGGGELSHVLLELARRARPGALKLTAPISVEQSRLEWFTLKKKRRKQAEIERQFGDDDSKAVQQLIAVRAEILDDFQIESADLTQSLAKLRIDTQRYNALCDEVQTYVSQSLFGFHIRSCAPSGIRSLTEIPSGLAWLIRRDHRVELRSNFWQRRYVASSFILLAILLFLMRPRLIRSLHATEPPTRRISTDRFIWTTRATIRTMLLAAPIPILAALFAMILLQAPSPSDWISALGIGFRKMLGVTTVGAFVIESCRPGGLGIVHFQWNTRLAARLSSAFKSIGLVYVPMMLLAISLSFGEAFRELYFESIGRLAFIVAHAWLIWVLSNLLRQKKEDTDGAADQPVGALLRFWQSIWPALLIGTPVALIVMAVGGYVLTAVDLSLGLCVSAGLIAIGQFIYNLLIRWFDIRRRRLALAEAIEQRKTRLAAEAQEQSEKETDDFLHLDEETELGLDLAVAGNQTVAILRLIVNLAIMIVLYSYWSSVVPLTTAMDKIPVPMAGGLSVLTIVRSLLVGVVAFIVVRNLPGLLEFSVLRRSNIEAGTRNAIYTLCQYGVIGIAIIAISNTLELDWEKLGWMAAALSVGIGFGLQEVVGNFVCGLVVLFERPIRVGDVVTIEGTTGTVTNINMRATTITNWDRQYFVVPNKNLITGTILNWTLNASVNRLVFPICVSYGTDTEKACQILLDVAAENSEVLEDPKPVASFDKFADSALNLILRVYLPNLDNRISTTTDLNTEIAKRFIEAGIEIPFPQHDLHLRTGWESLSPQGTPTRPLTNGAASSE